MIAFPWLVAPATEVRKLIVFAPKLKVAEIVLNDSFFEGTVSESFSLHSWTVSPTLLTNHLYSFLAVAWDQLAYISAKPPRSAWPSYGFLHTVHDGLAFRSFLLVA